MSLNWDWLTMHYIVKSVYILMLEKCVLIYIFFQEIYLRFWAEI
jgi:hypothetical protein